MKKRIFSFIMAMIMVFTMLPVEAIALTTDDNGNAVYEIGDTVWVRGEDGEPTGTTVADAFWLPVYDDNDQPVTRQGLCELTEHTHSYVCAADCALAHTHSEECYGDVYVGCNIHAHGEGCTTETVYSCGVEAHSHDSCTSSEKCTLEEHDHAACETAVSFTCATEEHSHAACPSQVVYTCQQEHIHELTACGGTVEYLCGKSEHTHSVEAGCAYETVLACGKSAHSHSDGTCVMAVTYDCGKNAHSHENCTASEQYVGCVEHIEHNENCTTEKQLTCGKDEHTCVTEGCAADCAIAEHTHSAQCDMEGVYYQWIVVEDTSAAYAERGLPIHFFIAEPGQQVYPDGSYVNYREDLWGDNNERDNTGAYAIAGTENNSQIRSTQGIRNANDEALITSHVFKWPDGYDANTLKDYGSITIDGVTYSQTEYEIKWVTICFRQGYQGRVTYTCYCSQDYDHIHIDGILTKKVEPGEMNLFKEIPTAQAQDETFNFTLTRLNQDSSYNPMDPSNPNNIDRTFGNNGSINLTATIPQGDVSAAIVGAAGTEIGFGYYMLTEVPNDRWQASAVEIERSRQSALRYDTNTVFIEIATDGTVRYCNTYNGNYIEGNSLTVENERSTLGVTYQWKVYNLDGSVSNDLPENLGAFGLPAPATGLAYGSDYVYNTGYVEGTSYYDYDNGLLYTFHGWDTWSHSDVFNVDPTAVGYNALDDGDTDASNNQTVPMTEDTWINGYWSVSELEPSDAYLMVKKVVNGDEYVTAYLANAQTKLFIGIDPGVDKDGDDAQQVDVDYPALTAKDEDGNVVGKRIDVYQYDIPFVFTEYQADIPGYTRSTEISVTPNSNLALVAEADTVSGDTGYVSINPQFDPAQAPYNLGTVTYTNTYTKNTSAEDIHVYPQLTLYKTDYDYTALSGAQFTLYSDADCTTAVGSPYVTVDGNLYIDFAAAGLGAGTYYLKETGAPDGFVLPENVVYTIVVSEKETKEELRGDTFYEVVYCTLSVTVPQGAEAEFSATASQAAETSTELYTLHVYNEPILGELHVSKSVTGLADEDKASLSATVIVHGPITRDETGAITNVGGTWNLTLNEENGWEDVASALPLGEYLIYESFASVHGYTWKSVAYGDLTTVDHEGITSGVFKVENSTAIELVLTNTYEVWNAADFYIKKVDEGGAALAGAVFQLFSDEACETPVLAKNVTNYAVTGADGFAHFSGYEVPEGQDTVTYYLKEVEAPASYYLSSTIYKVEIKAVTDATTGKTTYEPKITVLGDGSASFDNTTDLLTVTNSPVLGQLTVKKTFTNNVIPQGLTSVTATVSGSGYSNTVTLNADNNWTVTLTGLPLGTYTVTEQNADAPGYTLTTKYVVNATETAQVTLAESNPGYTAEGTVFGGDMEIVNTYTRNEEFFEVPTALQVKKVGENNEALSGAVFTLTRQSDGAKTSFTTDADGTVTFDLLSGMIKDGAPVDGVYTLEETTAPEGYAKADTTWTVTIKEDDGEYRIVLNEDKNIFENFWDWIVGGITGKQDTYTFDSATTDTPATLTVKNVELADMTITKSFDGATPPAGAIIEVSVLDANGQLYEEVELTADNNWKYTVLNMPAGKYTVAEATASLHGYSWTGAEITVTGAENKAGVYANSVEVTVVDSAEIDVAVKNKYTTWESADFWVLKTADDGDTPLAGAIFELYADAELEDKVTDTYLDKTITGDNETGVRGVVHFQGFKVDAGQTATFYLKEIKAPENYYRTETVYKVTVSHNDTGYDVAITDKDGNAVKFNDGNDVLTVVNTEILGDLTITKTFGDKNALEPGYIRVDITGPSGYSETVTLTKAKGWTETLKDLHLGEYTITEQDASQAGYDLAVKYNGQTAENVTVELTAASDTTPVAVVIENTYTKNQETGFTPASFFIKKVDEKGNALVGAEFTLKDASGAAVAAKTTGADGTVTFTDLRGDNDTGDSVKYTLTETKVPAGYAAANAEWKVTVKDEDGEVRVVLDKSNNIFQNIWDWIVGNVDPGTWDDTTKTLTVTNVSLTDMTITKSFETGVVVPDDAIIEVTVLDQNGKLYEEVELTKANGWTYTVVDMPAGKYTVTEATASLHGYHWDGADMTVTGANSTAGTNSVVVDVVNGAEIKLGITNNYTEWTSADFWVLKTGDDGDSPLAGATFHLYADAELKNDVTATYLEEGTSNTTGATGMVHFEGFKEAGTFYLKETGAPANYYLSETVYKVVVTTDGGYNIRIYDLNDNLVGSFNQGNDVLTITNEEILGKLTITKAFGEGNAYTPESIVVAITGPNGYSNEVTLKAEENWTKTLTGLQLGEYSIEEQDASAAGYNLTVSYSDVKFPATENGHRITKTAENTAQFVAAETVTNTYTKNADKHNPASFEIQKVGENGEALAGAVFTLKDASNVVLGTFTTDETGKVTVTHEKLVGVLTAGVAGNATFELTETTAPAGYVSSSTVWSVVVKEDNGVCRIVLNEKTNLFENIWDWITGSVTSSGEGWSWANGVLTVENTEIKGEIGFAKKFSFKDGDQTVAIADDLMADLTIEIHAHGPVAWADAAKTTVSDMGQTHTLTLSGNTLTDTNMLIGVIDDLELGDYLVHETKVSVHGFNWTGADITGDVGKTITRTVDDIDYTYQVVEVKENTANDTAEEVTVAITNNYQLWDAADFYIYKVDGDGNELAGATFELYTKDASGNYVKVTGEQEFTTSAVTGSDGLAHFQNFTVPAGSSVTYYVMETQAPAHYYKNENVWEVTISHDSDDKYDLTINDLGDNEGADETVDGTTDTITVVNEPILGELTIKKVFKDITPEGIEKIIVNVTKPDNTVVPVELNSGNQWTVVMDNLPLGEYAVAEDIALAKVTGYDLVAVSNTVEVEFTDEKTEAAVEIINDYDKNEAVINNPDSITILKTDDLGKALSGAVFTLSDGVTERTFTTGADGKIVIDGLIGNGTVAGQSSKTYTLVETTAPVGHVKSGTEWEILVEEKDGKITINLNAESNTYESIWDWIVGNVDPDGKWNAEAKTLTVENPRMTTQVEVSKEVVFDISDKNDPFVKTYADREYKFQLSYLNDNDQPVTETVKVKGGETKAFSAKIPYGTAYKVEEITEEDFFNAEISDNYTGVVDADDLGANITVEATNTYRFEIDNDLSIELVKVASDKKRTPLKGAKFSLYDEDGSFVYSYVSDKNGEFTIDEITAPGAYTLKETKAPDGYYKLKKAIKIDVDYEYTTQIVNGENVIVRTLVAEVSGSGVYARTDGSYGIKNTEITDNPKTGDQFNMGLWVGIGGAAAAALIVLLILGKKKGKK